MLIKPITYKKWDGTEVTESFCFNLTKAELAEMELESNGGIGDEIKRVVDRGKGNELMSLFKKFLQASYGVRSEDGRRFVKDEGLWIEFTQTGAYDVFFMELVTDANAAAQFINAIMPEDMRAAVNAAIASGEGGGPLSEPALPAYQRENREPTSQELQAMSHEELQAAFKWKSKKPQLEAVPDAQTEAPTQ